MLTRFWSFPIRHAAEVSRRLARKKCLHLLKTHLIFRHQFCTYIRIQFVLPKTCTLLSAVIRSHSSSLLLVNLPRAVYLHTMGWGAARCSKSRRKQARHLIKWRHKGAVIDRNRRPAPPVTLRNVSICNRWKTQSCFYLNWKFSCLLDLRFAQQWLRGVPLYGMWRRVVSLLPVSWSLFA